ncbi:hypothetical protein [Stieleria varia]|uniref:Uncharacterized protein n=1 Tax=Stieleria varia TaxID=2528005 RepID=A0A5C6AW88_9BACT|nr:hypothetical protein [Stieleria varia]TWU04285.1 hypothetical protein Pla52n_23240 [Stieleria varia]
MPNPEKKRSSYPPTLLLMSLAAIVLTVTFVWWISRQRVELSKHRYDVVIALYRVCNQRSVSGLQEVEAALAENVSDATGPSAADHAAAEHAIQGIITLAKSGDWRQATIDCRELLDDQVRR